jgi:hypothetical protein
MGAIRRGRSPFALWVQNGYVSDGTPGFACPGMPRLNQPLCRVFVPSHALSCPLVDGRASLVVVS